jgi:uncharacterized membrane protein YtjA (UPF0391 family)
MMIIYGICDERKTNTIAHCQRFGIVYEFLQSYSIVNLKYYFMLRWTVIFLIVAIVAAIFGFGGIAAGAAGIAKILFFIFVVLFLLSLIGGRSRV